MSAQLARILLAVAAFAVATACGGGDSELGDCPPGSDSRQLSGSMVVGLTCTGCHHSQLEGAAREDAPVGMDFDKGDVVLDLAADIFRTAEEGSMPPPSSDVPRLSDAQIEDLRVYLACQLAAQ